MSIQLVTYANQTVTPTNDAIIYEKAVDQNGIFYGCNVTVTSNNVNITGGYGIVCGREFVINSESIAVTLAPSGTLDGRLYVRLDLADADAPIQLLTATGNTLPPLQQDDDVNFVNGTWEMELATFDVGVSALSNVVETFDTIEGTTDLITNLVNEAFIPTLNTITPLGFFKNVYGGYCQIGKLCIVNCSVYVDGTFAANDYYTAAKNLPNANVNSALTVTTANNAGNRGAVASVDNSGTLVIQSGSLALSYYTVYITGIYITT